jgi:hypothetical protein
MLTFAYYELRENDKESITIGTTTGLGVRRRSEGSMVRWGREGLKKKRLGREGKWGNGVFKSHIDLFWLDL